MRLIILLFAVVFCACSPVSTKKITRSLRDTETSLHDHTGLVIYDLAKQKTLIDYNGSKYFTPASNTKILTFYAALEVLGDSVPALRYVESNDSLIIWGTGDPSFLNPDCFTNARTFDFLKNHPKKIYYSNSNFYTTSFGPGWAWDDYNDYYSQERAALPIYGNSFKVFPFPDNVVVTPSLFARHMRKGLPKENVAITRDVFSNDFTYHPGMKKAFKEFTVPFKTDSKLITQLLTDTLHRKVGETTRLLTNENKTLYSVPVDSLLKTMMQQSDNFIAEHLLLACSAVLSDSLQTEIAIQHMQKNFFQNFKEKVIWKDGSGLSRYNLITPNSILSVWQNIYKKLPRERLFPLLAQGGKDGTLKNWYNGKEPYVFGKTGTLSNNHSLSGFLITKSGRTLVFAFMNANYVASINDVRNHMQRILNLYYENY